MLLFREEWRILICVSLLKALHDDIDAFIKEKVKDSNKHFIFLFVISIIWMIKNEVVRERRPNKIITISQTEQKLNWSGEIIYIYSVLMKH